MNFINNIDALRDEIYNNSKDILELLDRRRELAKKIGEYKNSENLKIRNREREIAILKSLSNDRFTELVLNLLFEFSINYEGTQGITAYPMRYSRNINEIKYIEYKSNRNNLIFLLSRIINPGTVVLCKYDEICEILTASGHHITDIIEKPDLVIYMDGRENQDIIIKRDSMLISESFLENKGNIYTIEIR